MYFISESCVFGLEGDSIKNPDSKMRKMGRELFDTSKFNLSQFFFLLRFSVPRLLIWLKVPSMPSHAKKFFCTTMSNVLEYRRKTGFQRKDFVQLLLQLKDKEIVEINSNHVDKVKEKDQEIVTEKIGKL